MGICHLFFSSDFKQMNVAKWRSLYDSVNCGDELNQGEEFDKAAFFFINTEVSAQYREYFK